MSRVRRSTDLANSARNSCPSVGQPQIAEAMPTMLTQGWRSRSSPTSKVDRPFLTVRVLESLESVVILRPSRQEIKIVTNNGRVLGPL